MLHLTILLKSANLVSTAKANLLTNNLKLKKPTNTDLVPKAITARKEPKTLRLAQLEVTTPLKELIIPTNVCLVLQGGLAPTQGLLKLLSSADRVTTVKKAAPQENHPEKNALLDTSALKGLLNSKSVLLANTKISLDKLTAKNVLLGTTVHLGLLTTLSTYALKASTALLALSTPKKTLVLFPNTTPIKHSRQLLLV